jgi:hypothetical protein
MRERRAVKAALRSSGRLLLAILLTGATHHGAPLGFVNLPQLLATHPLRPVLASYDRGIAALRGTQTLPGLVDPAAQAADGAAALQRDAAAAQSLVQQIASRSTSRGSMQEGEALASVLAARNGADRAVGSFQNDLVRGTDANLSAYERSIAQRSDRAYAARAQQLRERELALAFRLARENAGKRLTLRLKVDELHLAPATRAQLEGELSALNDREADALAVMRRNNAVTLANYWNQLQHDAELAIAAMTAQVRSKAGANLALRRQVLASETNTAGMLPNLPAQLTAFSASYRVETDATEIVTGLQNASRDLSRSFREFGQTARSSQQETEAQIRTLEANRKALYQSMVAQISRAAQRVAQERHLDGVDISGSPPAGSVDLTSAVRAELAGF